MAKVTRRYMTNYDATQQPPAGSNATAELFSGLIDLHKKGARILEKEDPFVYPSSDIILVKQGTIAALFNSMWRTFEIYEDIRLSVADLDTGTSFSVGKDYYVYLVDDGGEGYVVLSANSTYPNGATAENSRKLGGFHFGHIRCVNNRYAPIDPTGAPYGDNDGGWKQNVVTGIIQNSVWDLQNRPSCAPEGMVLVGSRWVDIYQSSAAESISFESGTSSLYVANGLLQSKYGQLPVTGSEGLSWYSFVELAARSGKRLQTYAEFIDGAAGNPGGQDDADDYGWTKTTNGARARTGCRVNPSSGLFDTGAGIKPFAISAHNLVDCVGNVYEWVNELSIRQDSTSWGWQNVLKADKGQAYLPNSLGLIAFACGGRWGLGVYCGGRSVYLNNYPWDVLAYYGSRLACDKLAL